MSAGLANRRGAEFSARIFSTNFQHADSQCTNFNSNNLRVLSPLVYNIYSVLAMSDSVSVFWASDKLMIQFLLSHNVV